MKIFFIFSYYTSFRSSYENGKWMKSGMPAVYKLFEILIEHKIDFEIIFIERRKTSFVNKFNHKSKKIEGLNDKVNLIQTNRAKWFPKFIYEYWLFTKIKNIEPNINPKKDILYCDRANIGIGAFFKRILKTKTILRLHGITTWYIDSFNFIWKLQNFEKWFGFKTNFDHVICSEDGTPGKLLIEEKFKCKSSTLLFNGVDVSNDDETKKNSPIINVLFLSRLDRSKGINHLIDFCKRIEIMNLPISINIVGDGPFKRNVENLIKELNSNKIIYHGSVSHDEIGKFYSQSDIYISFNSLGNLSNTVLESIAYKCNVITFISDFVSKRDINTYNYLKDIFYFVSPENCVEESIEVLKKIISNRQELEIKQRQLIEFKEKHLTSWRDRIEKEILIIKSEYLNVV